MSSTVYPYSQNDRVLNVEGGTAIVYCAVCFYSDYTVHDPISTWPDFENRYTKRDVENADIVL